mmetsp:Transcript_11708/g.19064  ORF Transcript_11708/g.19064 Transcript_11708/m.19064 type:complete len:240 (+) Transcript_11708:221-940(+)|eukprot:CAMPEP_0203757808 /NCGR_PEP_ID=MMETSP0098-20131031/10698_1 /ASSEMBLY_ACC=CAM_ASM_000208 /TAXON_ID=96639 /ORGANISM=" , Strain NY0313808BC1" /LENGTH=239 /DNA_ID=CAMNT_0050650041 /DNA_START=251 /DNA_END=970 /DNA_ORIENTATION=+
MSDYDPSSHSGSRSSRYPKADSGSGRKRRREGRSCSPDSHRTKKREDKSKKGEWGNADSEALIDNKGRVRNTLQPGEEKAKANFGLSGALNEDVNTGKVYNGIVMKWSEPVDAATPRGPGWRLFVFKGKDLRDTLYIHRQSAYLFGRESRVADIVTSHKSCSKQHAVLQFRVKTKQPPPGSLEKPKKYICPYILDLESRNGTYLNHKKIETSRYIELLEKDILTFGESSKEYVLMYLEE